MTKIDTSKLHYVKVPDDHIVIDFDIRDERGGVHLHYIYSGDQTNREKDAIPAVLDMAYGDESIGYIMLD